MVEGSPGRKGTGESVRRTSAGLANMGFIPRPGMRVRPGRIVEPPFFGSLPTVRLAGAVTSRRLSEMGLEPAVHLFEAL